MTTLSPAPPASGRHRQQISGRRRRWRGVAVVVVAVLTAATGVLAGTVWAAARKYDSNVRRIDAFSVPAGGSVKEARARTRVDGPMNFLVVGSDSRAKDPKDPAQFNADGGQRTDTIMLMHLQSDQKHGYVVSIPRDTFVHIPVGGTWQGGSAKINAAYQYGGIQLLVRTVEEYTGDHIDHVLVVDFKGLERVVDAVGGVDVVVDQTVRDTQTHQTFKRGVNHLNGQRALFYVRQRHGLPGSDYDRIKRQHQFLSALLRKAISTGTLTNPIKLNRFLDAVTKAVSVDRQLRLIDLVLQLRGLRPADLTFMTTPIARSARDPVYGDVEITDHALASQLFAALKNDTMVAWARANPRWVSDPSHGF
ncbi:MAG: LCP family protein [Actinomycetota bacterium]|nr:LCP family protein [Actinomycetota bacterium]